jgi:2-amino-4-hydroxy-6-hydroxymethyldihydropteridine diphosphokinase
LQRWVFNSHESMIAAYIGLGSNLGKRRKNLLRAWARLGEVRGIKLVALSSPYISAPVGMQSTNWFINAAGSLQTTLQAEELLAELLAVEAGLGRKRKMKGKPEDRPVDLDLLYWNDRVCNKPRLILPHPEIANRLFVLLPLTEIAPQKLHPVYKKTSLEMLQEYLAKQMETALDSDVKKTSWAIENIEVSG